MQAINISWFLRKIITSDDTIMGHQLYNPTELKTPEEKNHRADHILNTCHYMALSPPAYNYDLSPIEVAGAEIKNIFFAFSNVGAELP